MSKKPTVKNVTANELVHILKAIKGAKIATIVTETDANLLKTGNDLGHVRKHMTMNIIMNFNYRTALDKALIKQGLAPSNRPVRARTWGERVPNSPFITHKDALYLEVKLNGKKPRQTVYKVTNTPVEDARVAPFVPKFKPPLVHMYDFKIENVKEVRTNGFRYIVG